MERIWKPVVGFEGLYEVSNQGDVRRVGKRMIKPRVERNGYLRYHLSKNNVVKSMLAHRIVALAFIENPKGYKTVNHINEDKTDNRVENLEWCDMSYQNSYGIGAINRNKFKEKPVSQYTLDGQFVKRFDSVKKASIELRLHEMNIHFVCKRQRGYKQTGGFVFKYEPKEIKNNGN